MTERCKCVDNLGYHEVGCPMSRGQDQGLSLAEHYKRLTDVALVHRRDQFLNRVKHAELRIAEDEKQIALDRQRIAEAREYIQAIEDEQDRRANK